MRNPRLMYPLIGVLVIGLGVVVYLLVGRKPPSQTPRTRVAATQGEQAEPPAEAPAGRGETAAAGRREAAAPGRRITAEAGTETSAAPEKAAGEKETAVVKALPPYQPLSEGLRNPFGVPPEAGPSQPEWVEAAPAGPSPPALPEVPAPQVLPTQVPPTQVAQPPLAPMAAAQPPIEPRFNWQQFAYQGARRRPSQPEPHPLSVTGTVVGSDGQAAAILTDGSQRLLVRTGQRVNVGGRTMEVLSVDRGSVVLQEDQRRIALQIGGGNR